MTVTPPWEQQPLPEGERRKQLSQHRVVTDALPGPSEDISPYWLGADYRTWQPTYIERQVIEHLASIGYSHESISEITGKSVDSLRKHCAYELRTGRESRVALMADRLFQKGMSGDTAAMIFYLKARAGWKEGIDFTSSDGSMTPQSPAVIQIVAVDGPGRTIEGEVVE